MNQAQIVVDAAGGAGGGAGRLKSELDAFLAERTAPVRVIGRDRQLTPSWLVRREVVAGGVPVVAALNNVSFAWRGVERRVLVHNALHFLAPAEGRLLAVQPRSLRAQIPVVRRLLHRADVIAVPCSAMAQRVADRVPAVRDRLVVLANPVSPVGPREPTDGMPTILVPVVPSPFKNVVAELRVLLAALDRRQQPTRVRMTAYPHELPDDLARHPRLDLLGQLPHHELTEHWRRTTAVFFPCQVESFGYPLAEARVYGLPVLAPDTAQSREVAGDALTPYRLSDVDSLAEALDGIDRPVVPEPDAFERGAYFTRLLGLDRGRPGRQADRSPAAEARAVRP
ncbi:glycosyltransferase [Micromonospora tarensis]|uniref:Glycosyltransferase n=1 Tax=Micromonospora tarensis TaxID=2806100 RepID=A0ABS1YI96_9ACTN|nr:glycosyltransferase [Micromonospora tarensis]MBM0277150.1 glycosyltransferase [Micromonospora tarensis]